MVAFIESENRASVHMHQQLGFIHVGQMRRSAASSAAGWT